MIDFYYEEKCDGVVAAQEVPLSEVDKYGIVKLVKGTKDQVEKIVEKPKADQAPSNLASYGRYVLTPKIFDYLKADAIGLDDELWVVDAIHQVAKTGKIRVKVVDGEWMTTGDPLRYMKAHISFMLKHHSYGEDLGNWLKDLLIKR